MTDQGKQELAEQYRVMMQMFAWKHFEGMILNRISELATKTEDNIPIFELDRSVGLLGECRGKRNAIQKIKDDLEFILNGLK